MHKVETTSRGSPQRFFGETWTNGVLLRETFITLHFEWLKIMRLDVAYASIELMSDCRSVGHFLIK